jgi:hypothetical protein
MTLKTVGKILIVSINIAIVVFLLSALMPYQSPDPLAETHKRQITADYAAKVQAESDRQRDLGCPRGFHAYDRDGWCYRTPF